MPRSGGGVYSKPAGTTAVTNTTIESAKYNSVIDDLVADANAARPVSAGGTGAANAADARTNLGISATNTPFTPAGNIAATNVQAALAELDADTWTKAEADTRYASGVVQSGTVQASLFGAVGDGVTNDGPAINAALAAVGTGGTVLLSNRVYATEETIVFRAGQMLRGPSPSGDVFGGTFVPGCSLIALPALTTTLVSFGADPAGGPGTLETFGGGIENIQLDGQYQCKIVLRLAACMNAKFEHLRVLRPAIAADGYALWLGANPTLVGLDNTIRACVFKSINCFAYGASTAIHNVSNGTEGGITGCMLDEIYCFYGTAGAGNGAYLSSMDSCSWRNFFTVRGGGGSGVGIYLDGNAPTGKNVQNNLFHNLRFEGGPLLADGKYSNGNIVTGINALDYNPSIQITNDATLDYHLLEGDYGGGDNPGLFASPEIRARRKDKSNNAVSVVQTLIHDLGHEATTPAIGIGVAQAFEVRTSGTGASPVVVRGGQTEIASTTVTGGAEQFEMIWRIMVAGTLVERLRMSNSQLLFSTTSNPIIRTETSAAGAGNFAGVQMKTGFASSVFQMQAKGDALVFGISGVGDFMSMDNAGNLDLAGTRQFRVAGQRVMGPRITGWGAATGTATRTTFATGSVTLPQLAERVKALIDDLITQGPIGP